MDLLISPRELSNSGSCVKLAGTVRLYIGKNHVNDFTLVQSVFRLAGSDEDALTSALGFLLAHDRAFCIKLLHLSGIAPRRPLQPDYAIHLQEVTDQRFGRRDIVIESGGMRIVLEAKIGGAVPTAQQLLKYASEDRLWEQFSTRGIVALTQVELPVSIGEEVRSTLSTRNIRFSTIQWYQILELALSHSPSDGLETGRYILHEFIRYIRRDYEMGYYDAEILVQDVNPLNAEIFSEGWMYVTALKDKRAPLYFAPYFTRQGSRTGISMIGRVLDTEIVSLASTENLGDVTDAPSDEHNQRWSHGLTRLRERAECEGFAHFDIRLFFLDRPVTLGDTPVTKRNFNDRNPTKRIPNQIPKGFSLRFDELLSFSPRPL